MNDVWVPLLQLILLFMLVFLSMAVHENAKKRGHSTWWALVVFLFPVLGLTFYFLRRLWDPNSSCSDE